MDATIAAPAHGPAKFVSFLRIGLVQTVGFVVYLILPAYVGILANVLGFGSEAAGYMASACLAGIALGTFVGLPLQRIFGTKIAMVGGLAVMAGLDFLSPFVTEMLPHGAIRFAAGLAGGIALAQSATLVSRPTNGERGFSVVVFMNTLFAATMFQLIGPILNLGGIHAFYWVLGGLGALTALLLAFEPLHDMPVPQTAAGGSRAFTPGAILCMIAFGLLLSGLAIPYTYLVDIGVAHQIDPTTVALVLSGSALLGLVGAATAGALGTKLGRIPTLVTAISVIVAMLLCVTFVEGPLGFLLAWPILVFFWNFSPPYFAGLLVQYDPTGKALASATSLMLIFNVAAPSLAAALLIPPAEGAAATLGNYQNVMLAAAFFVALTIPLYVASARKV